MIKASVIIPAFNAEAFILQAISSACQQTETAIEILVIDDCSTDSTTERVLSVNDDRIRLLRTAQNGGPSAARNLGFDAAVGEWIVLLDADDTMDPTRIALLTALGERQGADMVSDNLLLIDETGATPPTQMISAQLLPEEQVLGVTEFIERNLGGSTSARVQYGFMKPILRRNFLNSRNLRYDATVRFAEDFALYVQCLRADGIWWLTPKPLYHYLVRENSLTDVQTSADLNRLRTTQLEFLNDPKVNEDHRLRRALRRHLDIIERNFYYRSFTDAVKARDFSTARALFLQSPRSAALIVQQSLGQGPTIFFKLLRGGYGRLAYMTGV